MSDSLQPHEPQHTRPPHPSPTPRVYPNSCPLSWWCHPTISSSVIPFSSCLQSFPASGSFPGSQFFAGGGQSIGVSASASVLPMNTQDWAPWGWTGWISLQSKGLSRDFSNIHSSKASILQCSAFFIVQLSCPYMTTGKSIDLTRVLPIPVQSSFLKKYLCIYLAVPGLRCSMWDLVPWPEIESELLPWECGVLVTGLPGKSPKYLFFFFLRDLCILFKFNKDNF